MSKLTWSYCYTSSLALASLSFVVSGSPALAAPLLPGDNLQAAIDAATPGSQLDLGAGIFSGGFTLRPGVSVVGAGIDVTVIQGSITVPAVAVDVELAQLTAGGITSSSASLELDHVALTNTAIFQGAASGEARDTQFRWYLANDGTSSMQFTRITTSTVAFSREAATPSFVDSSLGEYMEFSGTSQSHLQDSTMRGGTLSGTARASLSGISSSGTFGLRDSSQLTALDSGLGSVALGMNGTLLAADSSISSLKLTVAGGTAVQVTDLGPGLIGTGTAASSSGGFGASLTNVEVGQVAYDIAGVLQALGGGLNGYSYVRSGGQATFSGFHHGELMIVEGTGQTEYLDATLAADLKLTGTSQAGFDHTFASSGLVSVEAGSSAQVRGGSSLHQLRLLDTGALEVSDAEVRKLFLVVEPGRTAWIDGLEPGMGSGRPVVAGPGGGPSITLADGMLTSYQLWVRGEADVRNSRVDDYLVVEQDAYAHLVDTVLESFGLLRGAASVQASALVAQGFLTLEGTSTLSWTGGTLAGYAEGRQQSALSLRQVALNGNLELVGASSGSFDEVLSTARTVKVRDDATLQTHGGTSLHLLEVHARGFAGIHASTLGTLVFDVAVGHDFAAEGLHPGMLDGTFGPTVQGPRAAVTSTQVNSVSVLTRGSSVVRNSELNGYTFSYQNASATFEDSVLRGVTYFLEGSQNTVSGGSIEHLFYALGSSNGFDGVRFDRDASVSIGGHSSNTFSGCTFEEGITLAEESQNNFGDGAGNPGGNDFSGAAGYFNLANNTPHRVMAQGNLWGAETEAGIAALVIDVFENPAWGEVVYTPFLVRNRAPLPLPGDALHIMSTDYFATVIPGMATDPDGDAMSYRWLEGETVLLDDTFVGLDGSAPLVLGLIPYLGAGSHVLTLEVTDANGATARADVVLAIGNAAPAVVALGAGSYAEGESVVVSGEVSDFDGDLITYTWSLGEVLLTSGQILTIFEGAPVAVPELILTDLLPLGTHTLVLEVSDGINTPELAQVSITIVDITAPVLSPVASPALIWPPNGRMHEVVIDTFAMDNSGAPVALEAQVSSNESRFRGAHGQADWTDPVIDEATGTIRLSVRAEMNFGRNRRTYTVRVTAIDAAGNRSSALTEIKVAPRFSFPGCN